MNSLTCAHFRTDRRSGPLDSRIVIALTPDSAPLDTEEFERQLGATGHCYQVYHPFNVVLNSGRATVQQVRAWVRRWDWLRMNYGPWSTCSRGCASLTELFAPSVHHERLQTWPVHYPWIEASGFEYFRSRACLPARDAHFGLRVTLEQFRSRDQQARALEILRFKLDLLWSILDCLQVRYGLEGE